MDSDLFHSSNPLWYYYPMQRRCVKCKKFKSTSEFNFKNKKTGRLNARCKECTRKDTMAAYYRNQKYYLAYRVNRNKQLRIQALQYIYNYFKSHPCVDCGIADPRVLQFDHVRGEKNQAVSDMARRGSLQMIIQEMEKCEVRCANCHAIKTAIEFGYYRSLKQ